MNDFMAVMAGAGLFALGGATVTLANTLNPDSNPWAVVIGMLVVPTLCTVAYLIAKVIRNE